MINAAPEWLSFGTNTLIHQKRFLTEVAGTGDGVAVLVVAPAASVAVDSILAGWTRHVAA